MMETEIRKKAESSLSELQISLEREFKQQNSESGNEKAQTLEKQVHIRSQ